MSQPSWLKKSADVKPAPQNKDIKPGTSSDTGDDHRADDHTKADKVLDTVEGDQAAPPSKTTTTAPAADIHKDSPDPKIDAPQGDQKTPTEGKDEKIGQEFKHEAAAGEMNKDIKPGSSSAPGEAHMNVDKQKSTLDTVEGTQSEPKGGGSEKPAIHKDSPDPKINAPAGDQKQPTEGKDEKIGQEFKHSASITWLKKASAEPVKISAALEPYRACAVKHKLGWAIMSRLAAVADPDSLDLMLTSGVKVEDIVAELV